MKLTFKVYGGEDTKKVIYGAKSMTYGLIKDGNYKFACYVIHLLGKTIKLDKGRYSLLLIEDDN